MMKKYNKPEIVTLALDMVDVIETSTGAINMAASAISGKGVAENNIAKIETQVTQMNDNWTW